MTPRELAANLTLGLVATSVFLAALEGGARLVEPARSERTEVADYIWDWDDKMPGGFYVMGGGVGWPPWEEYNRDGLRDRTRSIEKPAGWTRIAFLGDSVTLGAELQPREAYPQLLEARYAAEGRRAEVMSIALWGWSTRQERIAWRRIASRYRPDQAVLAVCLNDIPELHNNLARPPGLLLWLYRRSALVRLAVGAQAREIDSVERLFSAHDSPRVRRAITGFLEEVRSLRREVEADGAAFALVVFPFRFQVEPGATAPVVQRRIAEFCRDEGLRCLDLLPTLSAVGPAAFIDYDHLSPKGAQLVADTLHASGLLAHAASDPETLRVALVRLATPAAAEAAAWLDSRGEAPARKPLGAVATVLTQGSASERQAAAWALGAMGEASRLATDALAERLHADDDAGVRLASARSLGSAGSREALPALFAALADPSEAVRAVAAQAIVRVGPAASELQPLVGALASSDPYVAAFAAWSLGNLGADAEPAVGDLARALGRAETNAVVASALSRIGPAAGAAVPALIRALGDPVDHGPRWRAARALGRIGPAASAAVPALTTALADPSAVVRAHAARALGRIGPGAMSAAAALQRATGDREPWVREEARQAIAGLQGAPPVE